MMRELRVAARTTTDVGNGKEISKSPACEEEEEVDVITVRDIRRAIWEDQNTCTFFHFVPLRPSIVDSISGCLVVLEVDTD